MDKKLSDNIPLVLNDKESCNYIIYSLQQLPSFTQNVNMNKLNTLIASVEVIKKGLQKDY
jgi:hypothetical protein|tara:strand:- start:167 stop:346 length:180 start_codon:yes stop_codon:yes gene_type:complete